MVLNDVYEEPVTMSTANQSKVVLNDVYEEPVTMSTANHSKMIVNDVYEVMDNNLSASYHEENLLYTSMN